MSSTIIKYCFKKICIFYNLPHRYDSLNTLIYNGCSQESLMMSPPPPAKKYLASLVTLILFSTQGPAILHRLGKCPSCPQPLPTQADQKQRSHCQNYHTEHHPRPTGLETPTPLLRITTERLYSAIYLDERIFYENPNITQEELDKMMAQYEQYQRGVASRSSKQESNGEGERRVPIRPRENMKDIIYNGVGVLEEVGKGNSRVEVLICSVIILTSKLTVTIIIQEEVDHHLLPLNIHKRSLLPFKALLSFCHLRHYYHSAI